MDSSVVRAINAAINDLSVLSAEQLGQKKKDLLRLFYRTHNCSDSLEIRIRTFSSGHLHHVRQCHLCGRQSGNALGKSEAQTLLSSYPALPFDTAIETAYLEARRALLDNINRVSAAIAGKQEPDSMALHALQLAASQKRKDDATTALDQAIDDVARAFIWRDIVPLVIGRTQEIAEKYKPPSKPFFRFGSEGELKKWLEAWIGEDFEVFKEVIGTHLTERVSVKIDYVLQPRQHLIDAGFLQGPIGLEVKYLRQEQSFASKASRFVWQAVSYTDCSFELPTGSVRLPRVLLFSNMSFEDELGLLKGIAPSAYENEMVKWMALLELANHANVGNLVIHGGREARTGWKIKFASGTYFSKYQDECSLRNAQLFQKIRIGNF